jgi:hypothetical protein
VQNRGCQKCGVAGRPVEDEVVVVATAEAQLGMILTQSCADGRRPGEVKRGARDRGELAGRDQGGVDRGEAARRQLQEMLLDGARALPGEVPIGVIGEVDDRGSVGFGPVVDAQPVVVIETVGHRHCQRSAVPLLAIGTDPRQAHAGRVIVPHVLGVPDALVETDHAAMERIGAVVGGELIGRAIEGEAAGGDAVGIASRDAAKEGVGLLQVSGEVGKPENDVC